MDYTEQPLQNQQNPAKRENVKTIPYPYSCTMPFRALNKFYPPLRTTKWPLPASLVQARFERECVCVWGIKISENLTSFLPFLLPLLFR